MKYKGIHLYAFILSSLFISNTVTARESGTFYAGGQYAFITRTQTTYPDFAVSNLIARTGYNFNTNLALEGRYGLALSDDTQVSNGIDTSLEVSSILGVYAVAYYEVTNKIELYGLLGFISINESATGNKGFETTGNDVSYGFGAEVEVAKNIGLTVEYISYYRKANTDVSATSFGINYKF